MSSPYRNESESAIPVPDDARTEPLCACQRLWNVNNHRLPSSQLLEGNYGDYAQGGLPLYRAALNGDGELLQRILSDASNQRNFCASLTEARETALHVAVGARKTAIVRILVGRMSAEELKLQDNIGNTAFCMAAATGNVEIAEILKTEEEEIALMRGAQNKTPLYIGAVAGHPEMVRFLYGIFRQHINGNHLENDELRDIFFAFIHASLFDLAIEMLIFRGDLAWESNNDNGNGALGILAQKPSAFADKNPTWPRRLIDCLCCGLNTMQKKAIELTELLCVRMSSDEQKSFQETVEHVSGSLFVAAKLGNYEFLAVLIKYYPDLIFRRDGNDRSIFHFAVLHRHASIFKLIHNLGLQRTIIVKRSVKYPDQNDGSSYYNMLHFAAKLPSSDRLSIVSGAALQMQRELLWFKEVENLTEPSEREKRDSREKLTPRELFTKEHDELRQAGGEWMRSTANSGMLVATLITTVVFTTASTLPGGNKEDGSPTNIGKVMFHVFMVSDAIAMSCSIISSLMFLSIFTSRYAEEDFLIRLPLKLVAGFTALLLSMMALMVSFTAMFFLAYEKGHVIPVHQSKLTWVPCLAAAMSFLPIISFVFDYKLFRDFFRSTVDSKFLFRNNKSTF